MNEKKNTSTSQKYSKLWILPRESHTDSNIKDFKSYFNSLMDDYFQTVISLNFLDDKGKMRLEKICNALKETISIYLNGFPGEAYISFKSLMDDVKSDFSELSSITYTESQLIEIEHEMTGLDIEKTEIHNIRSVFNNILNVSNNHQPVEFLYRIRSTDKSSPNFTKLDLFHRSFEDYKSINNYRFSIPGYPCLYLGSSFEVCYSECQKPKLEEIWLMKCSINDSLKLIDLTKSPRTLLQILNELTKGSNEIKELIRDGVIDIVKDLSTYGREDKRAILKKMHIDNKAFNSLKDSIEKKTVTIKECVDFSNKFVSKISGTDIEALSIKKDFNKFIQLLNYYSEVTSRIIKDIKTLIIIHPIQIASSIKKAENSVFTPEYIVPQLLMQWLRKNPEFYGVKYNSTQCVKNNSSYGFNLALPARDDSEPYCKELLEKFTLNEPVHVIEKIGIQNLISDISSSFINNDFSSFNHHIE